MTRLPSFSFIPHPEHPQVERLVCDGKLDEGSCVNMFRQGRRSVYVTEPDIVDRLYSMRCSELAAHFFGVILPVRDSAPVTHIHFNWCVPRKKRTPQVQFIVPLDLQNWHNPWTPVEFADTLVEIARHFVDSGVTVDKARYLRDSGGTFAFPLTHPQSSARDVLQTRLPTVLALLEETHSRLASCPTAKLVSETFRFPDSVSVPAQRYLLYFTRFLSDLGIEATSQLSQSPGTVLFSVKPLSKDAALERISEALRIYLHLPTHPDFLAASAAFENPAAWSNCGPPSWIYKPSWSQ